jgi:hypothetical protein
MTPRIVLLMVASSVLLVAVLASAVAGPARSQLESMLPDACEGFGGEKAIFCVGMTNLTFIHNGGFMTYVDRGVETALVRTFTRDTSFYSAVIYGMNSVENASAIMEHFRSTYNAQPNEMGDGGFEHTSYGMNYIYFCLDDVFVTLEGSGESSMEGMKEAAEDILTKAGGERWPVMAWVFLIVRRICDRCQTHS